MAGQLRTAAEAAGILRVRESWLKTKAAARLIPCTFIGKHLRFSDDDIAEIMKACWLSLKPGLTPHGLTHSHRTWMAEDGIPEISPSSASGTRCPACAVSTPTPRSGCATS